MKLCRAGLQLPVKTPAGQDKAHGSVGVVVEAHLLLASCREQGNLCRGRQPLLVQDLQGVLKPCWAFLWVTSGGRRALWQYTGQSQVRHKVQHLQQHQACASSACKSELRVPKEALQSRLATACAGPQRIWLQGVWQRQGATRLLTDEPLYCWQDMSQQDMGTQAARSDQDSANG